MNISMTVPKFELPRLVRKIGTLLPQWPHSVCLVGALNIGLRYARIDPETLSKLEGKHFCVRVLDTGGEANYTLREGWFRPLFQSQSAPDLTFAANLSTYLQMVTRQEDPDTLFFNRQLTIVGDTDLGLLVKNTLDAL